MFADLHHLAQFVSLDQGGHVAAVSFTGGTHPGETSIFFGAFDLFSSKAVPNLIDFGTFQALPTSIRPTCRRRGSPMTRCRTRLLA